MPDDQQPGAGPGDTGGDTTGARPRGQNRPAPRPSPASRARRIGGRPVPPRPGTGAVPPPPAAPPRARRHAADVDGDAALSGDPVDADAAAGQTRTASTAAVPQAADAADGRRDAVAGGDTAAGRPERTPRREPAALPAWLSWAPAAILAAGALAMAVVVAVVSHGVWWGDQGASQQAVAALRDRVTASAKTCLAATNTYKYTDLDAFEKAGTACTTGKQTTQFRKAVDTLIRKNAPKLKFTQTAQVNKAAIESVAGGQWTILMYGQLQVTNVSTPSGRVDPFAALVRMEKVKGKWVISSLDTVSSPVNN